jgi:hypothetical protein
MASSPPGSWPADVENLPLRTCLSDTPTRNECRDSTQPSRTTTIRRISSLPPRSGRHPCQYLSSQATRRLVVVACGRSRKVQPRFLGSAFLASSRIWGHPRITTSEPGPVGLRHSKISESILQWAGSVFENFPGSSFTLIPLARATKPVRPLGALRGLPAALSPFAPLVRPLWVSNDAHNMLCNSILYETFAKAIC